MKKAIAIMTFLTMICMPGKTPAGDHDLLTGDVRLACEAILCLSTGSPPSECDPSLSRYFSIEIWDCDEDGCWIDWSATYQARLNFLNMCPVVSDKEHSQEMHDLTDALVHGAVDQCKVEFLNRNNKKRKLCELEKPKCVKYQNYASDAEYEFNSSIYGNANRTCIEWKKTGYKYVISKEMPKNCKAYYGHAYTDIDIHYEGDECKGGKWVK